MKKIIVTIFLSILITTSCVDLNNKSQIMQLQSEKIIIPRDITCLVKGRDSLINNFYDSKMKMIIYIDSTVCSSCVIDRMYNWNRFLEYAEDLDNQLRFYFIIHPKKKDTSQVLLWECNLNSV